MMSLFSFVESGLAVTHFKLVRCSKDIYDNLATFHPFMCHQIYGESEQIFGFQNLKIKLYYSAANLHIYCAIEFDSKDNFTDPNDLLKKISSAYELSLIENVTVFERHLEEDKLFHPHGTLISSFELEVASSKRVFEIYYCTNDIPGFREFHQRLQTFLLWFIDAANFVDFDDTKWKFFIMFEKYQTSENETRYAVVGFMTVYEYYAYPALRRPRISQVLILPPFQSIGLCGNLLNAVYEHYAAQTDILDITVEVPTDEFQRVRDFIDCKRVLETNICSGERLKIELKPKVIEELRSQFNINKKQANRIFEILLLRSIKDMDDSGLEFYAGLLKRRLNQPYINFKKSRAKRGASVDHQEPYNVDDEERDNKIAQEYEKIYNQYKLVIVRLSQRYSNQTQ